MWYLSWKATSPSAEDRLTVSQRSVEEGFRLQRHQNESARRAQPSQNDRDEPADRDLGRQAAGCCEGVEAVAHTTNDNTEQEGGGGLMMVINVR